MKMEKQSQPQSRKVAVWSRETINALIELYKKHECLWNHWHETYKSKEKRNRAIEEICTTLRITKFDFGKKIHNLRNQFNTEMKKLELRIEAGGETVDSTTTAMRCKWSHFESLMFLRHVIEPRPGGYQTTLQGPKKMRLRFDYNSAEDDVNVTMLSGNTSNSATTLSNDDISQYQYDDHNGTDEAPNEDFQNIEHELTEVVGQTTREETFDQKYQPPQQHTATRTYIQPNSNQKHSLTCQHPSHSLASTTHCAPASHAEIINLSHDNSSIIELNSSNLAVVSSASSSSTTPVVLNTPVISSVCSVANNTNTTTPQVMPAIRDQWDAFGELVASEFRNLNSDISRKRLKRKIMQAMLEVGEEDDNL